MSPTLPAELREFNHRPAADALESAVAKLAEVRRYATNIATGDMPPFTPASVNAIGRNVLKILDAE